VYDNISIDGSSARKVARDTSISLRRTYGYIRRLKGKKLLFVRKKHTLYWLTSKGKQVTMLLQGLRNLTAEALGTMAFLAEEKETDGHLAQHVYSVNSGDKNEEMIRPKTVRHLRNN
jgi:sugar-specific transcriptional regulator TrmB